MDLEEERKAQALAAAAARAAGAAGGGGPAFNKFRDIATAEDFNKYLSDLATRTEIPENLFPATAPRIRKAKAAAGPRKDPDPGKLKESTEAHGYKYDTIELVRRPGQTKVKGAAEDLVIDEAMATGWANNARLPLVVPEDIEIDLEEVQRKIAEAGVTKGRIVAKGKKMVREEVAWTAMKGWSLTAGQVAQVLADGHAATAGPIIKAALAFAFPGVRGFKLTSTGKLYAYFRNVNKNGGKAQNFAHVSMRVILKHVPRFYKTQIKKLLLYTFGQLGMRSFRMNEKSVTSAIANSWVNWNKAKLRREKQPDQMAANAVRSLASLAASQAKAKANLTAKLQANGTLSFAAYANVEGV